MRLFAETVKPGDLVTLRRGFHLPKPRSGQGWISLPPWVHEAHPNPRRRLQPTLGRQPLHKAGLRPEPPSHPTGTEAKPEGLKGVVLQATEKSSHLRFSPGPPSGGSGQKGRAAFPSHSRTTLTGLRGWTLPGGTALLRFPFSNLRSVTSRSRSSPAHSSP